MNQLEFQPPKRTKRRITALRRPLPDRVLLTEEQEYLSPEGQIQETVYEEAVCDGCGKVIHFREQDSELAGYCICGAILCPDYSQVKCADCERVLCPNCRYSVPMVEGVFCPQHGRQQLLGRVLGFIGLVGMGIGLVFLILNLIL